VIFIGTECPISNRYLPYLNKMQKKYAKQKVQFLAVNSLTFNTPEEIKKHYEDFDIAFPVLRDPKQTVLKEFDAQRTPEAYVLNKDRKVCYVGRIDDRYGYTYNRNNAARLDLEEAVKEVVAGKKVSVPQTEVMGCVIVRDDGTE